MTRIVASCLTVLCVSHAISAEPTYFRRTNGIAPKAKPVLLFDDDNLQWRFPVPRGHSTPVVVGNTLFSTAFDDSTDAHLTIAMDARSGEEHWSRTIETDRVEQQHTIGSPASATIASDGERIFVFFGSYGLVCYSLDGNQLWSKPMGPFQDEFGSSSSPILVGDKLILNEDHDTNNFLMAIDTTSGDIAWRVSRDEFTRSYATPTIWKHDGKIQIIVAGSTQLTAYDFQTGSKLWWVDGLARIVNTTPIVDEDTIYVSSWSPGGDVGERISMQSWRQAAKKLDQNKDRLITRDELQPGAVLTRFYRIDLNQDGGLSQLEWERHASVFDRSQNATLAIQPSGKGDITSSAVLWKTTTGAPYVSSPVLHQGVLYLVKDGGILTTLDAASGKVIFRGRLRGRGNYYASPVVVDDLVYVASQKGVLSMVSAEGNWKTLATHDFEEGIYATPVFAHGRMYVRTEKAIYCFQ